MLAISPRARFSSMDSKRVLGCTGSLPKTNTGVTVQSDKKIFEKVLVNRKVFDLFRIYNNSRG